MNTLRLAYGYQSWTTGIHLQRALDRLVRVTAEGPGHPAAASDGVAPMLWVESGIPWVPSPDALEAAPSAAYLIDTHRGLGWRAALATAFDCVYTAQRPAAEHLTARGMDAAWLPLAAPRELCDPGPDLADRRYDVAFVGQAPPGSFRAELVTALRRHVSVAPVAGRLEPPEMMDVYRSARVVINVPVNNDLNMRAFEAPGARAVMVTEDVPGLAEVLPDDSYSMAREHTVDAWVRSVNEALTRGDAQERANRSHHHVLAHHTYDDRAQLVFARMSSLEQRAISADARRRALAAAWSRWHDPAAIRRLSLPVATSLAYQAAAIGWGAATRGAPLARAAAARIQRLKNSR